MAKLKLEESLKHLNQCAELERQLKILSEPFAIMEHTLSFIARLNNTQRVEISIKQADICRRLAVATCDQVLFEQNTAIPDHVRTSRPYFRIERAPSGWIYSLPLWETDHERWQLRCFLTRLCQEDLGWIDVVVEQMLEAVDRTVSVKEVNSHRQHNSADYAQLVTMEKMASIGMLAAGAAQEINGPAAYVRANIGMMEGYLRDIDRAVARFEDLLEKSGHHELLDGWRKLKKEEKLSSSRDELFEMIQETNEGIERIITICTNLTSFTDIGTPQRERVRVHRCIDTSLAVMMFRYKDSIVVERCYSDVPDVLGNSAELGQVFLNLLINAAEAMGGKGTIILRIDLEDRWVRVRVQDAGPGIVPEHLPHIFEPLFTTTCSGEGTGLGLGISKEIIERHGGRIDVDSSPGKGAVFTVYLPPHEDGPQ